MNRFFIDEIAGNINKITDKEDIKHILKVLRLDIGDEVEIVDSTKKEYIMKIVDISSNNISLEIVNGVDIQREDKVKVLLYQGIPKGSKLEDICKNTTQAGIYKIVPVRFKRCVAIEVNEKKAERLQKIIDESAKQCKRTEIPKINVALSFDEMIKDIQKIGIIIGPEGGIDEKELEEMKKNSVEVLSLGNRILRTEIAPIIAKSILTYELESLYE